MKLHKDRGNAKEHVFVHLLCDVSTFLHQKRDDFGMAVLGGEVEGTRTIAVRFVYDIGPHDAV